MKKMLSLLMATVLLVSCALAEGTTGAVPEAPIAAMQEAPVSEPAQEAEKEAVTQSAPADPVTDAPVTDAPATETTAETTQTQPAAEDTASAQVSAEPTVTGTETAAPETASPTDAATVSPSPTATVTEPAATVTVLPEWKAEEVAALFNESNTLVCKDESMLQSDHPYLAGVQLWSYQVQGAVSIDITFDDDTFVAEGDRIAILEGGELYTLYAADELAGRTVTVSSDTVRIALLAASSTDSFGFAVKTVKPTIPQKAVKIVPIRFSAVLNTVQSVQLTWQGDGTQSGFALYRKASGQGTYTLLGKLASTATSYTDKALPQNKNVEYRLFGLDSTGKRSSEYLATYVYSLAATKVSAVRATKGSQVRWNKVSGASGYTVLRRVNNNATYVGIGTVTNGSTVSFSDTTADQYSTVTYRVQAYRTISGSTFTGLISGFYTLRLNFDKPAAPTVTTGLGYASVQYQKVSGVAGYLLYRKTSGGSYARIASTTATSYTDRAVADGGLYTYLVRPYGVIAGKTVSIASDEAMGYTVKTITLNVERSSGSGTDSATVTWSAVPNATRYRLMRYCSDGSESEVRTVLEGDTLTFADTGLAVSKEYSYTLRPYIGIGGDQYVGGPTSDKVDCKVIHTYRALVIGQMYTGSDYALHGTENDSNAVATALSTMSATDYAVTQKIDLTGPGILSAIQTAFRGANDNDVSLFFYSGHGVQSTDTEYLGALCGTDLPSASAYITPTKLRNALDTIPGTKIVIIDACHSGNLVGKNAGVTAGSLAASAAVDDHAINQKIASSFISAFATAAKANLATGGYYVLVAAHSSQTSIEMFNGYKWFGYFTTVLCQGSGYDEINDSVISSLYADSNNDRMVSLSEAYNYVIANTRKVEQVAQVYPTGSKFVLYGR